MKHTDPVRAAVIAYAATLAISSLAAAVLGAALIWATTP